MEEVLHVKENCDAHVEGNIGKQQLAEDMDVPTGIGGEKKQKGKRG